MTTYTIATLAGDGIGPEVMNASLRVLDGVASKEGFEIKTKAALIGGAAIDSCGVPLPSETLNICELSDAILFGSVGGPRWDHLPVDQRPERGSLLPLRKHFELYLNLRPAKLFSGFHHLSPLRKDICQNGFDILVVRELTGGIYFSEPKGRQGQGPEEVAFDTMRYSRFEIERIARKAFDYSRSRKGRLCSIDKANVLCTSVLWREVVNELAKEYRDVTLEHLYIDNAVMQIMIKPSQFDVVLAPNMFGDIISDQCAMLSGSLGMLPSASLNEAAFGLYEPAGGSAPDIAGLGVANPIAQILSAALLLRYSLGQSRASQRIQNAVQQTLIDNIRTKDIASVGSKVVGTEAMADAIIERL